MNEFLKTKELKSNRNNPRTPILMNSLLKYMVGGMIAGGILPGILHPLKITVFTSVEGIIAHAIGAISGIIIGLVIYKLRNK